MNIQPMSSLLVDSFSGEWGTEDGEVLTRVLRTANFNPDGSLDYTTPALRCIPERKVMAKRMLRGDIILEKSGGTPDRPVGIMAYYDSDDVALCSNFNHVLRFDSSMVNPFFMFHQLRWLREKGAFAPYTRKTTGLQNLQMKAFVNLDLHVPTRRVQDEVAAAIKTIDSQRRSAYSLVSELNELVKSRFVEMFEHGQDWELRPLAECCATPDDIKCGPFGSQLHKEDYISEGVPVWGIPEVNSCFERMPDKFVSPENGERLQSYSLVPGDVAMNRKGNVGQAALFDGSKPSGIIHSDVLRVRVSQGVLDPAFLVEQLHSSHVVREQVMSASTGAIMAGTNVTKLKRIKVFVPPLALQREFAAFVRQVDKLEFETQQAIDKLQMLYDSLAQEYFATS